jgi:hypothetical protein
MIISSDNVIVHEVAWLKPEDEQRIMDFLQGAIYCWCNQHNDSWFSVREIMGGNNRDEWDKTPLGILYDKHIKDGKSHDESWDLAGKEEGKILKKVINQDARNFETKEYEQIRQYKWKR